MRNVNTFFFCCQMKCGTRATKRNRKKHAVADKFVSNAAHNWMSSTMEWRTRKSASAKHLKWPYSAAYFVLSTLKMNARARFDSRAPARSFAASKITRNRKRKREKKTCLLCSSSGGRLRLFFLHFFLFFISYLFFCFAATFTRKKL